MISVESSTKIFTAETKRLGFAKSGIAWPV